MDRSFGVDDVVGGGRPPWRLLLLRGLFRRCPRCGAGDVFASRWRLRERCGRCGYRFVREPGFQVGAWFVNFMVLQTLLLGLGLLLIWRMDRDPDGQIWPVLLAGAVVCVAVPVAFFRTSRTLWAAIDLGMTPLELDEIVDAADAVGGDGESSSGPDLDPGDGRDGGTAGDR